MSMVFRGIKRSVVVVIWMTANFGCRERADLGSPKIEQDWSGQHHDSAIAVAETAKKVKLEVSGADRRW